MNLSIFATRVLQNVKSKSPEILAALGASGVITTAYLSGKASYQAALMIDKEESVAGTHFDTKERFKERTQLVWKLYIPTAVSGTLTIACIVASYKGTGRRTAAAVTAYSLTERAFAEYRDKVVEEIGKSKEGKIRDKVVQERITNNPNTKEVIIVGGGQVLCCELYTHRYFRSDMETLRKAQNDINGMVVNELYVTLDEFYDIIGLPHTAVSSNTGWNSDKMMELIFTTALAEDGEPCLAFDYNYVKPLD